MSLIDLASLVLAPTATKEGKVYSAIPDTGDGDMTFTRGSAATRVNSAGLIEKERANFLLQSNTFDTTWTNSGSTETSGQSGYDGSNDAWLLTKIAGSGRLQQAITKSGVCTLSVYAKAGTLDWIWIRAIDGVDNPNVFFDLQNGVKGITGGTNYIDSSIEQVGATGWYRLKLVFSQGITEIRIYPADDDGDVSGTSGNILIQDAMLNEGLVAQPYIETTTTAVYEGITDDVPRVDYSGGGCPSLLLEPQRTNVVTSSEHIGSYSVSNVSLSYNNATSPEGVQNATLVTGDAGTLTKVVNFNPASSGAYTISVFAKYDSHQWIQLGMGGIATYANFDIQNGVVGSTNGTSDIEDYGNGWYRCSVQMTTGTPISHYIGMVDSGSAVRLATSSSTNSFWAYGMQSEIGSYSTSYIPTYGTSTTRVADACYKTGISSLIGQTEGTMFVEVDTAVLGDIYGGNNRRLLTISDGTLVNRIVIAQNRNTDAIALAVVTSSTLVAEIFTGSNQSGIKKIAVAYANNDFVMYVNGVQIGTDTSGAVPPCSRLGVGIYETAAAYNAACPLNQAMLFPTRLTNDQLEELTK